MAKEGPIFTQIPEAKVNTNRSRSEFLERVLERILSTTIYEPNPHEQEYLSAQGFREKHIKNVS